MMQFEQTTPGWKAAKWLCCATASHLPPPVMTPSRKGSRADAGEHSAAMARRALAHVLLPSWLYHEQKYRRRAAGILMAKLTLLTASCQAGLLHLLAGRLGCAAATSPPSRGAARLRRCRRRTSENVATDAYVLECLWISAPAGARDVTYGDLNNHVARPLEP